MRFSALEENIRQRMRSSAQEKNSESFSDLLQRFVFPSEIIFYNVSTNWPIMYLEH